MTRPLRQFIPYIVAVIVAGFGCVGAAIWIKDLIESQAITDVRLAFGQAGHEWADVTVDGLTVTLTGTAPDEATRFAALSVAGKVVDASRIVDDMEVEAAAAIRAPAFSIEVLKNEDGVSLIGLVPLESDPETIVARARAISGNAQITDLLESADFAPPPGWERALAFGLDALESLPRSKVSIKPERVSITAVAKDAETKRALERRLNRDAPPGLALELNISAPRPVIAPFTLRFVIDANGARFDACSADTDTARTAILSAAIAAGLQGNTDCVLGLGTPSTRWGEAAVASIEALAAVGKGTVTMSNADVTLIVAEGTERNLFDRAMGELEGRLPAVFSLNAVLPTPQEQVAEGDTAPAEFSAVLTPEGMVQLRGRLGDEATRAAVQSFAAAAFGTENVHPATRIDENVPPGWPKRILAALESLTQLANGAVTVTENLVEVTGVTGNKDGQAEIARILSSKLEGAAEFSLDVTYSEALDPLAALPTPEECIEMINTAAGKRKITFQPGSTDIDPDAMETIDAISDILRDCQAVPIEIGGHTDSQGRESMNEQLSQARADSVLNAIMARRVLVSNITAKGYGEAQPVADNKTEDGREANRRIEFRLVLPDETAQDGAAADEAAPEEAEAATEETNQ